MANTHNVEFAQWILDEIVDDDDFHEYYRQIDATYERFCAEAEAERELREIATERELQVLTAALEDDEIVSLLREVDEADARLRATEHAILTRARQEMLDMWNRSAIS
jgi:hypothetical protein